MECQKCGKQVSSYSKMRKWCYECRKKVAVEQAKVRKRKSKSSAK